MSPRTAIDHHATSALLDRLTPAGGVCAVAGCVRHPAPLRADRGK